MVRTSCCISYSSPIYRMLHERAHIVLYNAIPIPRTGTTQLVGTPVLSDIYIYIQWATHEWCKLNGYWIVQ